MVCLSSICIVVVQGITGKATDENKLLVGLQLPGGTVAKHDAGGSDYSNQLPGIATVTTTNNDTTSVSAVGSSFNAECPPSESHSTNK